MAASETLIGTVEAVTKAQDGIRLAGREGWLNFSQGYAGRVPDIGEHVTLRVSPGNIAGKYWINALSLLPEAPGTVQQLDTQPASAAGSTSRDLLTLRCSALKSACKLASGHGATQSQPGVTAAQVLQVADKFLEWLLA